MATEDTPFRNTTHLLGALGDGLDTRCLGLRQRLGLGLGLGLELEQSLFERRREHVSEYYPESSLHPRKASEASDYIII